MKIKVGGKNCFNNLPTKLKVDIILYTSDKI